MSLCLAGSAPLANHYLKKLDFIYQLKLLKRLDKKVTEISKVICSALKFLIENVHSCLEAVICAGGLGLGPEGLQVLDTVEVWFFEKFLSDVKSFKWTVLEQKLKHVIINIIITHAD